MGAYVTFDSLDAGRTWHTRPPGLGRLGRIGCIPPGRDEGLGFVAAIATVAGAAFQAGGAVGAALISADAQKYAVKQQTKADLQIALARAHSELEQAKVMAEAQTEIAKETTKQRVVEVEGATQQLRDVSTNLVPVVGLLGAAALVTVVLLKD